MKPWELEWEAPDVTAMVINVETTLCLDTLSLWGMIIPFNSTPFVIGLGKLILDLWFNIQY